MKSTIIKLLQTLVLILFFTQFSFAQLSNFTLTVSPTNETCTANGLLSFTTSGTTVGATMLYSIYLLPNTTTPITTLSGNMYGGLVAGNYRVVATQSLGNQTGGQQQDVTISNQITLLTYQLSGQNVSCSNNGQITVNVTTGTAVGYEIFAGPVIKPLQTSNIFTGLSAGNYQIRVFDACGEGVVQSFALTSATAGMQISNLINTPPLTCPSVLISHVLSSTGSNSIIYPLTIVCTVFPPTGPNIVYNQIITVAQGNASSYTYSQNIVLFPNQSYSYNLTITDGCGNVYTKNSNVLSNIVPVAQSSPMSCNLSQISIKVVQTVIMTAAPTAYPNALPFNYTSGISSGTLTIQNIPPGTYTFTVTDVCGNPHILNVVVPPPTVQNPTLITREGCDETTGSLMIKSQNGTIVSIFIVEAPVTYTPTLPQNVAFYVNVNGSDFFMNSLPIGQYKFHLTDSCGNQFDVTITLQGYHTITNTFNVTENCNSFNLELHHTSNSMYSASYFLQKYDPVTNQWVHPGTGFVYVPGTVLTTQNGFGLINNTINTNIGYSGHFRIMMNFIVFGNAQFSSYCFKVLNEFDFDSTPKIIDVYSFLCSNSVYEVIVNATGLGPLLYRITTKDGLPFVLENGTDNRFLGLQPGIYNFQVEDVCGNILNSLHDITNPTGFPITASNFCSGQTATLSVPNFPFLTYEWWEASAPTVILSTTSQLLFPSFNAANDQGTYFVRIVHLINATCINNEIESFVVTANGNNPNAGLDGSIAYCGSQGQIDLFALLSGSFDLNGTWSALSTGGTLTNNNWNAFGVSAGVYQFKYTVTGLCNTSDEALVTITINAIPQTPIASVASVICDTQSLQLFATFIPNVTYQWSGPNGFVSNLQNPVINPVSSVNNGTYTVRTLENGCQSSTSSVTVLVAPLPEFVIEFNCMDNLAVLTATPIQNSFDSVTVSYQWSNSNGFSSLNNPATITGEASGIYTLTITNSDGCSNTNAISVASTMCSIPQGVSPNNDGLNDTFNLSGFNGVKEVKIYNRYGTLVFEQENYVNEWKGQDYRGHELPSATYYYVAYFDNDTAKTGWVYLIRDND